MDKDLRFQKNRDKSRMRRRMRQLRAELDPALRAAASAAILEHLLKRRAFQQAKGVHCFVSLPEEVDTAGIFRACWSMGKTLYVPFVKPPHELHCTRHEAGKPLVAGALGVLEPPQEGRRAAALEEIDLLLAPGLAFDRKGGRLGYGKGYYDGFLRRLQDTTPKTGRPMVVIGLAFEIQITEAVPMDPLDIPIQTILTEQGALETTPR